MIVRVLVPYTCVRDERAVVVDIDSERGRGTGCVLYLKSDGLTLHEIYAKPGNVII